MKFEKLAIVFLLSVLSGTAAHAEDRPLFQKDIDASCADTVSVQGIKECRHAFLNETNILRMTVRDGLTKAGVDESFISQFNMRCPRNLELVALPHDVYSLQMDADRAAFCTFAVQDMVRSFPDATDVEQKDVIEFRKAVMRAAENKNSLAL